MNMPDKSSYGPVSQKVHMSIESTLGILKDHPKVHSRIPTAARAAALVLILGTTAFAVANRAGLSDFFAKWNQKNGYELPAAFTDIVGTDKPLLAATAGDLDIVVVEAIGDGETYYFATTVSLKEGVQGHLINIASLENGFVSAPTFDDDLPVYYVGTEMVHDGKGSVTFDWITNDDGSISFFSDPSISQADNVASMECWLTYARVDDGMPPLQDQFETEKLPFSMPVEHK